MEEKKKKILIVEDDLAISSMYQTKLEQEGFVIFSADNGLDGINMAINKKPDLVLLDIMLPQIDGFSVLRKLRSNDNTKKMSIILLTNLSTEEDKHKGEKYGATDYIVKSSLTPSQVSQRIKKYL